MLVIREWISATISLLETHYLGKHLSVQLALNIWGVARTVIYSLLG